MYIKDICIIESVCKRYDDDILTFESTMKLIDNICDKY